MNTPIVEPETKPVNASADSAPGTQAAPSVQAAPRALDWFCLILIIVLGGSAFSLIHIAIDTLPPILITVGRLWVGAFLLVAIMLGTGRRFPPLFERDEKGKIRIDQRWVSMGIIGSLGTAVPFFIFPWAQQYVESGLAGVYMALMPIWTLGLAAVFANEALTGNKLIGFFLGFVGVLILMGPAVLGDAGQSGTLAQFGLVFATLCYAGAAVVTRRAPFIRPRIFAAGTIVAAAITATPALLFVQWTPDEWSAASIASTIFLGALPTGLGAFIIVIMIQRVGAGFMSYSNYLTPILAIILGAILFNERLSINVFIALGIVIAGLAISQLGNRKQ